MLTDSQSHIYESNLYILFTQEKSNDQAIEAALSTTNLLASLNYQPSLIEYHLGFMLSGNELPEISNIKHMVDDRSDDISDILSAIQHLTEAHAASLPPHRRYKEINWRAKLILAELRDWIKK